MVMLANMSSFFKAEVACVKAGLSPINPCADIIACIVSGDFQLDEVLSKDEPLVKRSDGILMLPGWLTSEGARQEYEWAKDYNVTSVCVPDIKHIHLAISALKAKMRRAR
jgi:hypothetical protein